jgi:hypothetical protein
MGSDFTGSSQQESKQTQFPGPAQAPASATQGYNAAQQYFQSILGNPPVYGGPRPGAQPASPLQTQSFNAPIFSGNAPSNVVTNTGANQLASTASGNYLFGPGAQAAVASEAAPIFRNFQNQVIPQIADRSQIAGQGVSGSRRGVAQDAAVQDFAETLGTSVIAPIFNAERQNMVNASALAPAYTSADLSTATTGAQLGTLQRGIGSEQAATQQQAFEEPIFRQSSAGQALLSNVPWSPGGSSAVTRQTGSQTPAAGLGYLWSVLGLKG